MKIDQESFRAKRKNHLDRDFGRSLGLSEPETDDDAPIEEPQMY